MDEYESDGGSSSGDETAARQRFVSYVEAELRALGIEDAALFVAAAAAALDEAAGRPRHPRLPEEAPVGEGPLPAREDEPGGGIGLFESWDMTAPR